MRLAAVVLFLAAAASADISEDIHLTTPELITKYGYPVETHETTTVDGYILTLHRIPGGRNGKATKGAILLQHGLLSSSADWIVMGPNQGFGYELADFGYDVWLGNNRGNIWSRRHTYLDPAGPEFWDFDWHEMGMYDTPAMIDYIIATTGEQKIFYAGHSEGTTQFFVMASERPEYNDKIRAMFALAPIAFMNHMTSPLVQLLAGAEGEVEWILNLIGVHEFVLSPDLMGDLGQLLCKDTAITQDICSNALFLVCGFDSQQLNATMLPVILGHVPAGASTKQFLHYAQEVTSGNFRQWDYGWLTNLDVYGSLAPPDYDLSKITAPVALHYSNNDWLAGVLDVERLHSGISNPIGKFLVPLDSFNHLDYLWAIDGRDLVYNKVVSLMTHY